MKTLTAVMPLPKAEAEAHESEVQAAHMDLFRAIDEGDLDAMGKAFKALPLNVRMELLDRMLLRACERGQVNSARKCLEWGASPLWRDLVAGNTAWHISAKNGRAAVIDVMAQFAKAEGKDVAAMLANANADGRTPLLLAAARGHAEACASLCKAGADANHTVATFPPPIFLAIEGRHIETVRALLDNGADPNSVDRNSPHGENSLSFFYYEL